MCVPKVKADADLKAKSSSENEGNDEEEEDLQTVARKSNISLLSQHTELKKVAQGNYNGNLCKLILLNFGFPQLRKRVPLRSNLKKKRKS